MPNKNSLGHTCQRQTSLDRKFTRLRRARSFYGVKSFGEAVVKTLLGFSRHKRVACWEGLAERILQVVSSVGKIETLVDEWEVRHHVLADDVREKLPIEERWVAYFDSGDVSIAPRHDEIDDIAPPPFDDADGLTIGRECPERY